LRLEKTLQIILEMNVRTLLVALCALMLIASCKKNNNNDVSPTSITLKPITMTGKTVKLEWSKLINDSLISYTIVRVTDTTAGNTNTNNTLTFINVAKTVTEYTDTLVLSPYAQYYVMANVKSLYYSLPIQSNKETYYRTDIDFSAMVAQDALYDRTAQQIYIYSSAGNIAVYDLASKKFVRSINTNATIGTCDMAMYNGKLELYVPRNDGWVFIYDAATLTQTDQISVGNTASSITCNNGKLFVSATNNYYSNVVLAYDRATKTSVTPNTGYYYSTSYLALIPNTNSEFFCVDNSSQVLLFRFDAQGNYVSQSISAISGNYQFSNPAVVYPNGSKVICGSYGVIVDSNLRTAVALPRGNVTYTSFAIDGTGNTIYAATNNKSIQAYDMGNYQLTKNYSTVGSPVKVFYNNGKLITVSVTAPTPYYYYTSGEYTFVEQL